MGGRKQKDEEDFPIGYLGAMKQREAQLEMRDDSLFFFQVWWRSCCVVWRLSTTTVRSRLRRKVC